ACSQTSSVSSGTSLVVSGVPALLVLTTSSDPSGFFTSQVHPEPKFVAALFEKVSRNASNEPHLREMASASGPDGCPPPPGFMHDQKNVWFQTCAALLKMPPEDFRMMSSRLMFSNSVPLIRLLRFVTYAW